MFCFMSSQVSKKWGSKIVLRITPTFETMSPQVLIMSTDNSTVAHHVCHCCQVLSRTDLWSLSLIYIALTNDHVGFCEPLGKVQTVGFKIAKNVLCSSSAAQLSSVAYYPQLSTHAVSAVFCCIL